MAATTLFALAVHPMTSDVGLVFFVWLAVTGTAALVFEERTLIAATALKTNVSATELFGRRGRRHLRSDPGYFFEPDAYRLYRRRARQVTAVGLLAAIALLVATVVLSVDDVLDVRAAIEEAREPWWRQR
jgi:hypothetical protein